MPSKGRYPLRKNLLIKDAKINECVKLVDKLFANISTETIKNIINNVKSRILICSSLKNDKNIVGCLIFKIHIGLCAEILLMGVEKKIQTKGIGSFLVNGLKKIIPKYTNSIYVKSDLYCTRFYKKNGFTECIRIPSKFTKNIIFKTTESIQMECRREDCNF